MVRGVRCGGQPWLRRRDPDLSAIRRAGRVTIVASSVFSAFSYLIGDRDMATYGIFSAVAMGFLAQLPGPARRQSATLLRALPAAVLLVTAGTLLAGSVWAATVSVLVVGFAIAFARAGGPALTGIAAGLQLFFILACFPPYAPQTLGSRLIGVVAGMGLLAVAERTLWPDRGRMAYEPLLADACDALADELNARDPGTQSKHIRMPAAIDWPTEASWPPGLPPAARPSSPSRHDQALKDAGRYLSFALARLRGLPDGAPPSPAITTLLRSAAAAARSVAQALRAGRPPTTKRLGRAVWSTPPVTDDPDQATVTARYLTVAQAVWGMAVAVRVALGATIDSGPSSRPERPERFPYAGADPVRLWWRRYAVHLTPRSIYFQGAVRIALALAAARLIAGTLELAHGFWVLLATLTLLRGRAAATGLTLGPAAAGTAAGAAAVAALLVVVGPRPDVYAAITPPIMVIAFAAGALFGLAWGQALFTVLVTLVFTQLEPTGVQIAEVRVLDVIVGALIGVTAGVLAWPRGASAEVRRSAARLMAAAGDEIHITVQSVSAPSPASRAASATARAAGELMAAAYEAYEAERKGMDAAMVRWQGVITVADHVDRGAGFVLDRADLGSPAPWRPALAGWAEQLRDACWEVAAALHDGRPLPDLSTMVGPAPDARMADVHAWLDSVAMQLARVDAEPGSPA